MERLTENKYVFITKSSVLELILEVLLKWYSWHYTPAEKQNLIYHKNLSHNFFFFKSQDNSVLEQCFFTMHSNAPLLKCRISLGWSGVRPELLPCSRSLNDTDAAGSITTLGVEKS